MWHSGIQKCHLMHYLAFHFKITPSADLALVGAVNSGKLLFTKPSRGTQYRSSDQRARRIREALAVSRALFCLAEGDECLT